MQAFQICKNLVHPEMQIQSYNKRVVANKNVFNIFQPRKRLVSGTDYENLVNQQIKDILLPNS